MKKRLFILFACLFVVNIGFGIILPVLPFYTERLVLAEGISPNSVGFHVGLLTGIYAFMQLLFAPLWGRWSDRFGRKPLLLLGIFGYALAQVLFGIASNLWLLYLARIIGGILAAAVLPAAAAYVADETNEENRNRGMAWLGTAMSLGVVIGPALGGFLAQRDWHFKGRFGHFVVDSFSTPFFAAAALAFLTMLIALRWLPESLDIQKTESLKKLAKLNWGEIAKRLRPLLTLALIGQFGLALFEAIFALFASAKLNFGPFEVGAIFVVCGLVMAIFQTIMVGYVTRRISEIYQIAGGFILMGLSLALLVFTQTTIMVFTLVGILAFGMALIAPNLTALISKQVDQSNTGAALGVQSVANNLGQTSGPVLGGILFTLSIDTPFLLGGAVLFSTGLAVIWFVAIAPVLVVREDGENT